jgi:hypothetical protein
MSRTKLILLGLAALVVVSVVATASTSTPASASGSCSKVKTVPGYCIEGVPLESAAAEVEGTISGASILKGTVASVTAEVKCEKGKMTGTIEGGAAGTVGKSTGTMTFEECKLVTPTNCKLSAGSKTIETSELKDVLELTGSGKRIEDKFEPKEGTTFASIGIEGKESSCVIAHVAEEKGFPVSGSQVCEIDTSNTEAETEAATHKMKCTTSGGLAIGTNPAEMTSEAIVKLKSGKKWSIKET